MKKYAKDSGSGVKEKISKGIVVRISFVRLIMLMLLLVMLLVWAFFIGVLVGRGEKPEDTVPEIARLMPSVNGTTTAVVSGLEALNEVAEQEKSKPKNEIMKPESLGFMRDLKSNPTTDDLTKAPLPTNIPPKSEKPANQPATSSGKPADKPADKPAASTSSERAAGENVFDYIYQVAASGDKAATNDLKNKLINNGFKASIVEAQKDGKTIYRLNVAFRGTPEDTRTLSEDLKKVGINNKILIKKTPTQ